MTLNDWTLTSSWIQYEENHAKTDCPWYIVWPNKNDWYLRNIHWTVLLSMVVAWICAGYS